ncbi:MarR family transcriptional regulator [Microcoleus sp. B3-D7]|jgi:MarR family transcriptional regulator, organic hydroperoxide resistance regulator
MQTSRLSHSEAASPSSEERALSPAINDSLGFLIADSARFVKRSLYGRIAPHGIRGGSWFALRVLWLEDGISQRELAKRLGVMEPWALEMVRSMERDGLVMRTRDEADRRRLKLTLTEKARSLEPKMMNIASAVNRLMLEGLTESEEVLLKLLLKKVRERLAADTEVRGELDEDSV